LLQNLGFTPVEILSAVNSKCAAWSSADLSVADLSPSWIRPHTSVAPKSVAGNVVS